MPRIPRTADALALLLEGRLGHPLPTLPATLPKVRDIRRASHVCKEGWDSVASTLPDCVEATQYRLATIFEHVEPRGVYWLFRKLSTVDRFKEKWAAPLRAALILGALTELYNSSEIKAADRPVITDFAVSVLQDQPTSYGRSKPFGALLQRLPLGALKTLVYAGCLRDPDPTHLDPKSVLQAAQALGAA